MSLIWDRIYIYDVHRTWSVCGIWPERIRVGHNVDFQNIFFKLCGLLFIYSAYCMYFFVVDMESWIIVVIIIVILIKLYIQMVK